MNDSANSTLQPSLSMIIDSNNFDIKNDKNFALYEPDTECSICTYCLERAYLLKQIYVNPEKYNIVENSKTKTISITENSTKPENKNWIFEYEMKNEQVCIILPGVCSWESEAKVLNKSINENLNENEIINVVAQIVKDLRKEIEARDEKMRREINKALNENNVFEDKARKTLENLGQAVKHTKQRIKSFDAITAEYDERTKNFDEDHKKLVNTIENTIDTKIQNYKLQQEINYDYSDPIKDVGEKIKQIQIQNTGISKKINNFTRKTLTQERLIHDAIDRIAVLENAGNRFKILRHTQPQNNNLEIIIERQNKSISSQWEEKQTILKKEMKEQLNNQLIEFAKSIQQEKEIAAKETQEAYNKMRKEIAKERKKREEFEAKIKQLIESNSARNYKERSNYYSKKQSQAANPMESSNIDQYTESWQYVSGNKSTAYNQCNSESSSSALVNDSPTRNCKKRSKTGFLSRRILVIGSAAAIGSAIVVLCIL